MPMHALDEQAVVVVGMGRSGVAAARLALAQGARVACLDDNAAAAIPDGCTRLAPEAALDAACRADVLVVSPGVAAAHPVVRAARDAGVDVVGELGFGWRFLAVPAVAITGTNGKSTVTTFTGALLEAAGLRVFTGGNLGVPWCEAVLAAATGEVPEVAVLEVSSYMMELPGGFDPRVAVVLNLTPDHLARHGTMANYGAHKMRLLERMGPTDLAMWPEGVAALEEGVPEGFAGRRVRLGGRPGVWVEGDLGRVVLPGPAWSPDGVDAPVDAAFDLTTLQVEGAHNREHATTAAGLALAMGVPADAVAGALSALRALPHRTEPVAEVGGVVWINDSKATNCESTLVAIEGIARPCVVLLGGEAKGPGFAVLAAALARHRAVVCFGGSGPAIADELEAVGVAVLREGSMEAAMQRAHALARPGDAVLLSPACASFDAFRNFVHRGETFRAFAEALAAGEGA